MLQTKRELVLLPLSMCMCPVRYLFIFLMYCADDSSSRYLVVELKSETFFYLKQKAARHMNPIRKSKTSIVHV